MTIADIMPTVLAQPDVTKPHEAGADGRPLRDTYLPFCVPDIGEAEIDAVVEALRSGWITTGPRTHAFERRFAEYVGARHALAVNSCTAALHLALASIGVGPGDEVITSPLTFCSTANVIVQLGAIPVFADVDADFNIEPGEIERRISPRTKAIIPVHHSGQPCRMDEILACARRHHIKVIEDAAHAVGAEYRGRKIGAIGDMTAFSFYATKNLTTGEGGMLTTDDDELIDALRMLSLHGMSKDAWRRYASTGSWRYEVFMPGFKYNMTDLNAALGLQQLARLEELLAVRTRLAAHYGDAFGSMLSVKPPVVWPDVRHAWHLYVIQLDLERLSIDRSQFIEALRAQNIGTSVHFIPVHLFEYYRRTFGYRDGDYPKAEQIFERIVSLPLYTTMTEEDVADVVAAVRRIVG